MLHLGLCLRVECNHSPNLLQFIDAIEFVSFCTAIFENHFRCYQSVVSQFDRFEMKLNVDVVGCGESLSTKLIGYFGNHSLAELTISKFLIRFHRRLRHSQTEFQFGKSLHVDIR